MLQAEEEALERFGGQRPILNEDLLRTAAVRQYTVPYTDDNGARYELSVTYSDLHPYFRVEVMTDHRFGAHQQPFVGNLCLLRSGASEWDVGETAADMIAEQMPKLLADRTDEPSSHPSSSTTGGEDREPQGGTGAPGQRPLPHVEPYANYYRYEQAAVARVDGSWSELAEANGGRLEIGVEGSGDVRALRAAILQVLADDGTVLRQADPAVRRLFSGTIHGRWCRLPGPPDADGGQAVLDAAIAENPALAKPAFERIGTGSVDVVGVVFTDESHADQATGAVYQGDAWVFVVRGRDGSQLQAPNRQVRRKGASRGRTTPAATSVGPYLVRGLRAGPLDMTSRIPTLAAMSDRTVAIFGTGGLGAPSAVEFAKAGTGKLHLVDRDHLDPGNAARWPLGYAFAGHHKLQALHGHLAQHWPYTELELLGTSIGGVRVHGEGEPQWESISRIVADSDIVYDATAETGVNYFLSELARDHNVPYVVVAGTEGGWGGYVARFRPDPDEPCWTCLMHHLEDDPGMLPPADPDPATRNAWPAGCTDPTFTGTGFDVATIALAGVRLAASTLCETTERGYPSAEWHYARYRMTPRGVV